MATQHSAILSADCHEPKHITNATTADAGKVITPSSATNGISVLRKIASTELSDATTLNSAIKKDIVLVHLKDLGTASSEYGLVLPSSVAQKITVIIDSAFTGNTTLTVRSGATVLGTLVLTAAGSAAGSVFSANLTGTVNANGAIEIQSDGGATGVLEGMAMIEVQRP